MVGSGWKIVEMIENLKNKNNIKVNTLAQNSTSLV